MGRLNAFTVDVEDGISIAMRDYLKVEMAPTERVVTNTERIIDLLGNHNIRGTFFILGEVAERFPQLIRLIGQYGHEIGVHSYSHRQYHFLTARQLREEVRNAKALLEDLSGKRVHGHRAPVFSIFPENNWALKIIAEEGFTYDSSIMPARTGKYGWPGMNENIHSISMQGGPSIVEVPLSVTEFFGTKIPACGGGYLRYLPYFFTRNSFIKIQKKRPVIVYLHPYETDTEKYPDFFYKAKNSAGIKNRIRLSLFRLNKGTVVDKLEALISEFRFAPLIEIIKGHFDIEDVSELKK